MIDNKLINKWWVYDESNWVGYGYEEYKILEVLNGYVRYMTRSGSIRWTDEIDWFAHPIKEYDE